MALPVVRAVPLLLCMLTSCARAQGGGSQTEPMRATVVVTDRVLNTVSPLLFGDNIEWTNNGMGLWHPAEKRLDAGLVAELREVGITHLRYPGGTLSDYFDWRKSVGTERSPIPNPFARPKGKPEYPAFGVDEFLALCRELSVPATITLNAGTGSVEEAVAWVRYLTDRKAEVLDYTVGNEIYLAGENGGDVPELPINKTPDEYADFYLACREGVRSVDPNARVGAIAVRVVGNETPSQPGSWMETVLRRCGASADFIDIHHGYAPLLRRSPAPGVPELTDDEFAEAFMGAPRYVDETIDAVERDIAAYVPGDGANLRVHITEYGPLVYPFGSGDPISDLRWNRSITGAVYLAGLYHVMASHPRIESANHLPLVQDIFGALVGIRSPGPRTWRNAVFYVFRTYSRLAGTTMVATNVTSPAYSTRIAGFVPAMNDVPFVEAGAFRAADGRRLTVCLIDRSAVRPAEATLDPGRSATLERATVLAGDSCLAENTPERPDAVVPAAIAATQAQDRTVTLELPPHSLTVLEFELEKT